MTGPIAPQTPDAARISRARRTALVLGLVAAAIFGGFIALTALTR